MPELLKINAIIFDLDGTIYDKKYLKVRFIFAFMFRLSLLQAFLKTRKQLEGFNCGNHADFDQQQLKLLIQLSNKSHKKCERFIKQFMAHFTFLLQKHYRPNADIINAIEFYNTKNIPIICLSDHAMVQERLQALKIDTNLFTLLKSSEEYGALKPSSKSFLAIAKELNIEPETVIVIGDRDDTDGQGAKNSGMQFLKYPDNFNKLNKLVYGT